MEIKLIFIWWVIGFLSFVYFWRAAIDDDDPRYEPAIILFFLVAMLMGFCGVLVLIGGLIKNKQDDNFAIRNKKTRAFK